MFQADKQMLAMILTKDTQVFNYLRALNMMLILKVVEIN